MSDTKTLNVYAKLLAVQDKLIAPKDKKNNFGKYNYRSAEGILEAVKPLLVEHKLFMTISDEIDRPLSGIGSTKVSEITTHVSNSNEKGLDEKVKTETDSSTDTTTFASETFVKAIVTIVNIDNPDEKVEVSASARHGLVKKGMDDAQVTGATSSYARKYALNGMFAIDDAKDADTEEFAAKTGTTKKSKPASAAATDPDF